MIEHKFDIAWRTTFTFLSFVCFGVGALILGLVWFPVIHLFISGRANAQRACRKAVHASFRLFITFVRAAGVLSYQISGKGNFCPGQLIVANHPSLIDVIFIVAQIPDAYCVVKEGVRRNFFTSLIVRSTGYVSSVDPEQMIERCVKILREGGNVVMFPEGTRTVPGKRLSFRRGAAIVFFKSTGDLVPVYLRISPPTLAKGEPWFKVQENKIQYRMDIGRPLPRHEIMPESGSERHNTKICTARLQALFAERLRNKDQNGKSPD
ncbi:MAG: lysophospholipid acyltransferase family protein [Gammaproteobacteria bacterium]|nr:lysophospholipid acyltransferase family protein [Gammaproteobacteria bacterium]